MDIEVKPGTVVPITAEVDGAPHKVEVFIHRWGVEVRIDGNIACVNNMVRKEKSYDAVRT